MFWNILKIQKLPSEMHVVGTKQENCYFYSPVFVHFLELFEIM